MTKNWLKPFSIVSASLLMQSCMQQQTSLEQANTEQSPSIAVLAVANPSAFERPSEQIYLSFNELGIEGTHALVVRDKKAQLPLDVIDKDGDGNEDGIVILVSLKSGAKKELVISRASAPISRSDQKLTQAEISRKHGGDWNTHPKKPEFKAYDGGVFENVTQLTPPDFYTDHSNWIRYEGPGIESDKMAYRLYLDERNGFDVFGKTTPQPILQRVGLDGYESYHSMTEWGMDLLKVGDSLGAGGFGFWQNNQVQAAIPAETRTATIRNNTNTYSSFSIDYQNVHIGQNQLNISALLSMQAGSELVHTQLAMSNASNDFVIGTVKHPNTELLLGDMNIPGDSFTYLASWGPQSLDGGQLGLAVLFRKRDFNKIVDDKKSYAAHMKTRGNQLDYYFVAVWDGETQEPIKSADQFDAFLKRETEKLTQPIRVRLQTSHTKETRAQISRQSAKAALHWSEWMADSELQRKTLKYRAGGWDTNRRRVPKFEYDIVGILPLAYARLGAAMNNPDYTDVLEKVTGSYIRSDGSIIAYSSENFNIDSVAPGRAVLALYNQTQLYNQAQLDNQAQKKKYKLAADQLREQLRNHPKTREGAFWHKKKYPGQLWLDGVYMGMPFLAEYTTLFEQGAALHEVVQEFILTRKYLRDEKTGLYYHAIDETRQQEWADPTTGLSSEFWGRGVGWLAMALVDTLEYLPADKPELTTPLQDMITELAGALVKYRDPDTGLWWQIMDKPNKRGNYLESSASAMFVYFFAKAVNRGYLPESYTNVATSAYDSLVKEFITVNADATISMTNQCLVAGLGFGRDGSYNYYMSEQIVADDPKGTAPFIMAGLEVAQIQKR
ncbi:glycoside hydrolase family 88 protein [Teredinibacter turnerae]|uniref:glycoside hydrolase family 88 protein n=1 Tax=Teredinibacter turnerae TaxID=2426 RepID=UPI0030CC1A71